MYFTRGSPATFSVATFMESPEGYEMMERIAEASPRSLARMGGVFQVLEALTATFGQASE
jgi:hypothetical protein